MKNITRLTTFLLLFSVFSFVSAQLPDWVAGMQNPEAKFEDTQRQAEAWFQEHGTGKGTGWKQYKRWEYYMETRVLPDGSQRYPQILHEEMENYISRHLSTQKRNSTNGNWQELGPVQMPVNGTGQPNGLGRLGGIGFHPTLANTFYVGAAAGGIWRTTDYGSTWTNLSNNLPRLGVSSIVVHPTNPNTIFIGTGDRDGGDAPGRGVYRSTDGGATWAAWNIGMGTRTVYEIIMHPGNPDIMVASTNGRIYRTVNGGANWTQTYSGGENFKDIAFKPGDPNIVYAASNDFYRSTDNGQSWTQITAGVTTGSQRIAIGVSPDDPNYVYLFVANGSGFQSLDRSTNSGVSFTSRSNSPNLCGYGTTGGTGSQAWYDLVMMVDPNDVDHVFTGAINCWESFDGGQNWTIMTHWVGSGGNPAVHADIHNLEVNPVDGNYFIGCDGGIYYSSDNGATWPEISSGLGIAQVYKIGQSQTVRDLVINGYQDNGTGIYNNGNWFTEIGGDGMECIVDQLDETVMYGALYYGDVRRSTNGGTSFSTIAENGVNGINEGGAWVTPYKLHPANPDTMFVGYRNLWRAYNCKSAATNAVSWVRISNLGGSSTIRDIAISISNPNVIYISRSGGSNFYRSTNALAGSPSWTNLEANLPANGIPRDIEIHPNDPDHVWIALGNNIYESTDGGGSWTDISGSLPNIAVNTIVFDTTTATTSEALYLGQDVGVYYLDNSLADWIAFDTGLPPTEVTELEIYYDRDCRGEDMLRASTYGRGLWESDLRDPGTLAPDACFAANPTTVCEGMTVTLEDKSAYVPTSWNWTIAPATFTFEGVSTAASQNPQVSFSAPGTYSITLTATNANGNDVKTEVGYITVTGAAAALPLTEDFESAATCATTSDCGATVCALPNNWVNLTNGTEDDIDWRIDEGGTPSSGTGPAVDFAPGTATGNYAYTEASGCSNRTAIMVSPCLDLRGATGSQLDFAYHMEGGNMGELHLDVFSGGSWTLDVMPVLSGDQGASWNTRIVDLTAFDGNVIRLRFRGITGGGFQSDMAIDAISITAGAVLPLPELQFSGRNVPEQGNLLSWIPAGDLSIGRFELEKAAPNGEFFLLESIAHRQTGEYLVVDPHPRSGTSVYRLWVIEEDGKRNFAGQVEIETPVSNTLLLYPNPTTGLLNVSLETKESGTFPLLITDLMGKTVYSTSTEVKTGSNNFQLDLQNLEAGIYFVRYQQEVVKIIKR